ncbi:MAG: type II secretion system F family protein [Methylococcales bacterium]|nr:type II secretion system F family protein [Methylococcales bacterium]MDD5630664.1 type II secretion system F family protein [Methylococcales bacterium]
MDRIVQFIIGLSGDPVLGRWLVMVLFGSAVFALALAFYFLIFGMYNPLRKRLGDLTGAKQETRFFRNATNQLGNYFVIRERAGEKLSYDRERIIHAGYHDKNSLSHYYGTKILLTIGLPVIIFFVCTVFIPRIDPNILLLAVSSGLLFGFITPSFYLDSKVKERKRIIRNTFPDTVDQLIVCTEAGLGLDAGLQRVAKDTQLSNEIMAYELGLINAELSAGVAREQALKNLVNRTGVEEIRGLVSALSQSMRFGTSIGNTLRVFAEDLRDRRMQKAEEEAAKLAVKMLFPLAFCFFPGIFIVILGPALISIYAALGK